MSKYFFLLFFIFPLSIFAQIKVDNSTFNHGNIEHFNNDTAYFIIHNSSNKTSHLLPTQPQDDYEILCDIKSIPPNESMKMAIVFYTDKKGKFNLQVPVYFSSEMDAVQLTVKGNIKSIDESALSKCPSIENSRPLEASQVPIKIIVKDAENEQLLSDLQLIGYQNKDIYNCVQGFYSSTYSCKCNYGKVKFKVAKNGYQSKEVEFNYDANNHLLLIYLEKNNIPEDPIDNPLAIEDLDTSTKEETFSYIPVVFENTELKSELYKPNHLIFIVDISGSMKDSAKLDYLKICMKKLIEQVRPQDHITIITYAGKINIIAENYSGIMRDALLTAIDSLSAKGGSNGAQSMLMAYEIAEKYFIEDGNNQIILATDGLFNSSKIKDDELYKLVKKSYNKHQIKFTSIGFGKDKRALDFLLKLSELGKGNFLKIENLDTDINVLIEEVKQQSKK